MGQGVDHGASGFGRDYSPAAGPCGADAGPQLRRRILSGGIGNILDRLRLGYVVDMLHFQFWPSYPTFNVADVCIVSGAILGAIYYVLLYDKHDRRKTDGASDPANGQ